MPIHDHNDRDPDLETPKPSMDSPDREEDWILIIIIIISNNNNLSESIDQLTPTLIS